jgi:hypothetical protein
MNLRNKNKYSSTLIRDHFAPAASCLALFIGDAAGHTVSGQYGGLEAMMQYRAASSVNTAVIMMMTMHSLTCMLRLRLSLASDLQLVHDALHHGRVL